MGKVKSKWVCEDCGQSHFKWAGSCSRCAKWNTLHEEVESVAKDIRFEAKPLKATKPVRIKDIDVNSITRIKTGFEGLDHIMGGGLVSGSLNLIGGEPGIGKSTLMLQLASLLARQGLCILYVCGEESAEQTSLRAKRLGIEDDRILLYSETLFSNIKLQIDQIKPDILIIDSVQIVYKQDIPSSPGSVTQVREITMECMHLSKGHNITTFLIGHVTKSGEIAGPRVLEHMVDAVYEFEGDRQHGYRLVRSQKNRFGPTEEVAIFQMKQQGLQEVLNPSENFLQERSLGSVGSVIIPTIEGSRAILVEVQSLVAKSSYATSTRRSTGLDPKRLTLLLAVLEKKMGYQLHQSDVFVSIAGGMKITEPAIDLGIILSIASSFCSKAIDPNVIVIGEVGLGGEVRSVPRIESRLKEAIHMGFTRCFLSKKALKSLPKKLFEKIQIIGVNVVEEVLYALLK